MTISSRRRLLCREIPCRLASLAGLLGVQRRAESGEDAAYAAFDAEWRAMGPEMLAQAVRAAGLAGGGTPSGGTWDAMVKALWLHVRTNSDVG